MSVEPPLMRDVLNGVLNSRTDASGLFSSFPGTQLTPAELAAGITPANYAYDANPYNVMRFGATGDGVTDDTAACQAALDVVRKRGGTVYFPTPVSAYLLLSALNCTTDLAGGATAYGFTIRGEASVL